MRAVKANDTIRIYDSYLFKESIREIDGRIYDADDKAWVIPLTDENVRTLELMGATLDEELKARTESAISHQMATILNALKKYLKNF